MRKRTWDWSRRAQERADQARREDDEYWSGPTYAHGATDRSGWGKQWDREQKDRYDLFEHQQRQRAARKEARKEAERTKRDLSTPPPRDREKAERERREDGRYWGKPTSPQQPDPDWPDKVEKEFQERLEKEKKERADRKKAEREQSEKKWPAELVLLLSNIISIGAEIDKIQVKVDESLRATKVRHLGATLPYSKRQSEPWDMAREWRKGFFPRYGLETGLMTPMRVTRWHYFSPTCAT